MMRLGVEVFVSYLPIWLGGCVWIGAAVRDWFTVG